MIPNMSLSDAIKHIQKRGGVSAVATAGATVFATETLNPKSQIYKEKELPQVQRCSLPV